MPSCLAHSTPITLCSWLCMRTGPPADEEEDYDLPHWAGVLPVTRVFGDPVPDPRMPAGVEVPPSVADYRREKRT